MSYILIQVAFFSTLELLFGCREKFIYVPAHLIGLLGRSLHDSLIARYRQLGQRDFSGIMPPVALPAVPGFLIVAGYRFLRVPDRGSATLTVTNRKVLGMEYKNRTDK